MNRIQMDEETTLIKGRTPEGGYFAVYINHGIKPKKGDTPERATVQHSRPDGHATITRQADGFYLSVDHAGQKRLSTQTGEAGILELLPAPITESNDFIP